MRPDSQRLEWFEDGPCEEELEVDFFDELELSLSSYSGRGMFGKICPSISGPNALAIVEEAASRGVRGARTESLGLGSVVYWPALEWDERYVYAQGIEQ